MNKKTELVFLVELFLPFLVDPLKKKRHSNFGRVTESAKISLIAKIPKRSMISILSKTDYRKPNNKTG